MGGAGADIQTWKMGSSFLCPWHFVYQFTAISNKMELREELSNKIFHTETTASVQRLCKRSLYFIWSLLESQLKLTFKFYNFFMLKISRTKLVRFPVFPWNRIFPDLRKIYHTAHWGKSQPQLSGASIRGGFFESLKHTKQVLRIIEFENQVWNSLHKLVVWKGGLILI